MIDSKEIEPCPECTGSDVELVSAWWVSDDPMYMIRCNDCGRSTPWMNTPEECMADWVYPYGDFD